MLESRAVQEVQEATVDHAEWASSLSFIGENQQQCCDCSDEEYCRTNQDCDVRSRQSTVPLTCVEPH